MSRIGKLPIKIKEGVVVTENGRDLNIKGPMGELNLTLPRQITIEIENGIIVVKRPSDEKKIKALHGLWRQLIDNAIIGVGNGWEKKLDYKGVGYKAETSDEKKLVLSLGFSHPVEVMAPSEIKFNVTKNVITVAGIDKQKVGQVAANIRKLRPVEPYKGKGIKYVDEVVRRKLGKAAKTATAGSA
jgi:large subunit ribosomal protein L6